MKQIAIKPEHIAQVQQIEHVGAWLQAEAARLEAELAYVRTREATLSRDLQHFLLQFYGVPPGHQVTLDTARQMIATDDPDAPPSS